MSWKKCKKKFAGRPQGISKAYKQPASHTHKHTHSGRLTVPGTPSSYALGMYQKHLCHDQTWTDNFWPCDRTPLLFDEPRTGRTQGGHCMDQGEREREGGRVRGRGRVKGRGGRRVKGRGGWRVKRWQE